MRVRPPCGFVTNLRRARIAQLLRRQRLKISSRRPAQPGEHCSPLAFILLCFTPHPFVRHIFCGGRAKMKSRFTAVLAALALALSVAPAWAQSQTGEIFGKVTDSSGAVLPGVAVTLTGPSLLQPQTATTSETGSFQFPRLNVGTYNVRFELPGFKTVIKENIQVTVGFSANVSTQLGVSAMQETVTVTGESPIVDTK